MRPALTTLILPQYEMGLIAAELYAHSTFRPLGRTREVIDICRQVWRRERVEDARGHAERGDIAQRQRTGCASAPPQVIGTSASQPQIDTTLAGMPALSRLKSITRYLRLCPPPRNQLVMSPEFRLPPVRGAGVRTRTYCCPSRRRLTRKSRSLPISLEHVPQRRRRARCRLRQRALDRRA